MSGILVVDDTPQNLKLLADMLEAQGYAVAAAAGGEAALERIRESVPDLVLLDIMMPRKNGYQVCRSIKEDETLRTLPVLMLSAKSQPSDRFWAKRVGADGFVAKPFDPADLLREIHALLQKTQVAVS